jgi:two-component system chemotaxis sensor kinase CheA
LDEKIQVIVYSGDGRRAGFRVERILDIVEDRLVVQYPPTRKGSLGSAVIQGRVAEVLDVKGIINTAGSSVLVRHATPAAGG